MNIEEKDNKEVNNNELDDEVNDTLSSEEIRKFINSSKDSVECDKAESFRIDEEKEIIVEENFSHPYYDEDPDVGHNKFTPSVMLSRGCVNIPQSYIPISKSEMDRNAKFSVHDWMSKIRPPFVENNFDCVEVRFKNSKKDFFRIPEGLEITEGDVVAVEGQPGHDIGIVTLIGELCRVQMKKKKVNHESDNVKKLYRRAKASDIEKWVQAIERENKTLFKTREIINKLKLDMKVNDVEYQGDNTKAVFYYTADDRVDFRQLIKILAEEFNVRIEMKQIGSRQEASRLGGLGTCGRELCCSSWLNNFNSVSTQVARIQQIFSNPQKLAGQCGKLKCCLNFEYDVYLDELKTFPEIGVPIMTKKGKANYVKTNVFRRQMWYAYEESSELIMLSADDVKKLIQMNKKNQPVESLEAYQIKLEPKSNVNV